MRKKGRLNQVGIALFLTVLLVSILTAPFKRRYFRI